MKKYYFVSEIRGIVGEHSGNIRGAKTKAQKFAEQFDEEIAILVRSNKEIDCGKNIPANEEVCRVCNADGDVLAVCLTYGNAFAWCAENGIEGEIGEYEPYIEVGTYSENGNFEVEDYSSIDTGDGMWNIIKDYCDYVDTVCPEATIETVESVEETTVSETETVETEVAEKFIIYVSDDDLNVFCAKVFVGTVKELDDECDRIIAETNCEEYLHVLCYTDKRWEWVQKHYNQVSKSELSVVVRKTETAEQETELNAEVAEVEAEQTAELETFSKSKSESESEPTVDSNTVETYQGNINVLIVEDIANTFEMITHTGYFDTS